MAVAYVPAFLEDRATFIKERANGLYGATSFMIANFIIGVPYLCTSLPRLHCIRLLRMILFLTAISSHLSSLLPDRLLSLQLPANRISLLHVGHVALSRPARWRIPRRTHIFSFSQLRRRSRSNRIRKRPMDERRRISRFTNDFEPFLAFRLSLYRLRTFFLSFYSPPLPTPSPASSKFFC